MDAPSERYVEQVAEQVRAVVGSSLVGVYLHGSGALGGYDAARSDLDILVVVDHPLGSSVKSGLSAALHDERLPCPATGLELSVVTSDAASRPSGRPPFELHLSTAEHDGKVVDGATTDGDPDLVLHFAVCRSAGRLVGSGASTEVVFADVPRGLVLEQLADELEWAMAHAPDQYAVLNACRAWKFRYDGSLVSKVAGGEWALRHVQRPADGVLVTMALGRQRGLSTAGLDRRDLEVFVGELREELRRA